MVRTRALTFLTAVAAISLCACGGVSPRQQPALLHIETEPDDAIVLVNEQTAGKGHVLAHRPVRLSPGRHRVTITAAGYFPHDLEVVLQPGVTTLRVSLREIPP